MDPLISIWDPGWFVDQDLKSIDVLYRAHTSATLTKLSNKRYKGEDEIESMAPLKITHPTHDVKEFPDKNAIVLAGNKENKSSGKVGVEAQLEE